jgi:hypothetical protein
MGLNWWHFAASGSSNAPLKPRGGLVEEVVIAGKAITRTRGIQLRFLRSFSAGRP